MGGGKGEIVQIELGSPERWYLIGAPDTDEPLPLVLAFHGDEGDPFNSTRYIWGSWWEENAPPFIVVMTKCPGCTSWYMGDTDANADYVWEVLADVATNHNVDVSRIYAVGFSGGSEFLSLHGFEFQDVFAGIQWTCGGNAYSAYTQPSRPDCKVRGRIVISTDDFLWDGAQMLLARLQAEGHEHEFVEAQCSGHCCSTDDHNAGAWAWFQTVTKCGAEVPGMCAELDALPPSPAPRRPGLRSPTHGDDSVGILRPIAAPTIEFATATDRLDAAIVALESAPEAISEADREVLFREAMAAYDTMLAGAHHEGRLAKQALQARYPRLRELITKLRR
jgi:predicted esterase